MGAITIWAMAEKSESKAKSKATDRSVRSTQALTAKQLGRLRRRSLLLRAVGMGLVVAKPWGDSELMILL